MPQSKLLSIGDLSSVINISRWTIYGWVSKRKIPFVKLGSRTLFDPVKIGEKISKWLVEALKQSHQDEKAYPCKTMGALSSSNAGIHTRETLFPLNRAAKPILNNSPDRHSFLFAQTPR